MAFERDMSRFKRPAIPALEERKVYEVYSRNLLFGVYDGKGGIMGIREKFGSQFLFTELVNDPPGSGTVSRIGPVLGEIPPEIPLKEVLGSKCMTCGTPARWTGPPAPAPWECEGEECEATRPCTVPNTELFRILEPYFEKID